MCRCTEPCVYVRSALLACDLPALLVLCPAASAPGLFVPDPASVLCLKDKGRGHRASSFSASCSLRAVGLWRLPLHLGSGTLPAEPHSSRAPQSAKKQRLAALLTSLPLCFASHPTPSGLAKGVDFSLPGQARPSLCPHPSLGKSLQNLRF